MELLEIEVKFYIEDLQTIRNRILALSPESRGRFFETNIRFDTRENRLSRERSLLRLRKDRCTSLTFKAETPDGGDQFKIHREWEVEISDHETMSAILEFLGYLPEQRYEKWRETFIFDGTVLCLDTMPYGDFLEIEGAKDKIKALAERLGLTWKNRIRLNYLVLFDIIRKNEHLGFNDVSFKNFEDVRCDIRRYLHLFRNDDP